MMDTGKIEEEARRSSMSAAAWTAKDNALEVKDIAGKDESLTDKAKDTFEALKDPGAPGNDTPAAS